MRIEDPAADLGVSIAIASAFQDRPVLADSLILGEVGLAGEIRSIFHAGLRINEAEKLGFRTCVLPSWNLARLDNKGKGLALKPVSSLRESLEIVLEPLKTQLTSQHRKTTAKA